MKLELWNRHGRRFPKTRGSENVMELLKDLIPGTAIEGEWVRSVGTFYVFEVTHTWIDSKDIEPAVLTPQEARREMGEGKVKVYTPTEETQKMLPDLLELGNMARVTFRDKIEYYWPLAPMEAPIDILKLPRDDWTLELKLNGDRVLAFQQPEDPEIKAMDIRQLRYDMRRKISERIVIKLNHPQVQMIPTEEVNFPRAYEEWKMIERAEGVVIKRRQSPYTYGLSRTPMNRDWRKRRWECD